MAEYRGLSTSSFSAFTHLAHNGRIINNAIDTIENYLENDNVLMYFEQPDGTLIKMEKGCKIHSAEWVTEYKEDKNNICNINHYSSHWSI